MVRSLIEITNNYISEHRQSLLFESIIFKQQLDNQNLNQELLSFYDISKEEEIISSHFAEYINNEQLLRLPFPNLYRIFTKFLIQYSTNHNQSINQSQITSFLFNTLDRHQRKASILFFNYDITNQYDVIERLLADYSNVFDFSVINSKNALQQTLNDYKENLNLKKELKSLKNKLLIKEGKIEEVKNLVDFIIPVGRTWTKISPTECALVKHNGEKIKVISSSTFCDLDNHHPCNLFNGKKEIEQNGFRWATNRNVNVALILIDFSAPVIANMIYMTSRDDYYNEAPSKFLIYASNDNGNTYTTLFTSDKISWSKNEMKMFHFENESSFSLYKIQFYLYNIVVSIAELNLCKI